MAHCPPSICRGKQFTVSGTGGADSIATVNWLLDHGAKVTVTGVSASSDIQKKVHDHIKRTARDGSEYTKMLARLSWSSDEHQPPSDLRGLFLSSWKRTIIGITGAYGKTTTAMWAAHLIGDAVVAGHIPGRPLIPALDSPARVAVIALDGVEPAASRVRIVSTDDLPNLEAAQQAARLAGVSESHIAQRVGTLPQVPLRQEVIHRSPKLTIVNDAMATKPVHGIAALRRWGGPTCILICGGDGCSADYASWAQELQERVRRTNIMFLTGNATRGMRTALGQTARGIRAYDSLGAAFKAAAARAGLYVSSVILFSPATPSGGLFADEYARGQALNALVEQHFRGRGS